MFVLLDRAAEKEDRKRETTCSKDLGFKKTQAAFEDADSVQETHAALTKLLARLCCFCARVSNCR